MIKFIRNIPWKEVLVIALLAALGIGAIVGISAAVTEKQKTVSSLVFERGDIDDDGLFIKSDRSIYTKNYIECQGLEITPDFEATGTYQVFYYDTNKVLLGATPVMDARSTSPYKKGSDYYYAKYCRIVITPEVPVDGDGYVDEDWKINFYEVVGIAGKFTIKVNKQQKNVGLQNLMDLDSTAKCENLVASLEGNSFKETALPGFGYCTINVEHFNSLKVVFEENADSYSYYFFDKSSVCVGVDKLSGNTEFVINDIPDNAQLICILYDLENVPAVYSVG